LGGSNYDRKIAALLSPHLLLLLLLLEVFRAKEKKKEKEHKYVCLRFFKICFNEKRKRTFELSNYSQVSFLSLNF